MRISGLPVAFSRFSAGKLGNRRPLVVCALLSFSCAEGQLPPVSKSDPRSPLAIEGITVATLSATPNANTSDDGGVYSCLMHPEVTSAAPGKCPKCGMTLVKQAPK